MASKANFEDTVKFIVKLDLALIVIGMYWFISFQMNQENAIFWLAFYVNAYSIILTLNILIVGTKLYLVEEEFKSFLKARK